MKSTYFDMEGNELAEKPTSGEYIEEFIGDPSSGSITAGHYIAWTQWKDGMCIKELEDNPFTLSPN